MTESSESVLAGTKRPPFRLVVRAIHESGQRLDIRPAVSEEFVVRLTLNYWIDNQFFGDKLQPQD